MLEKGKKHHLSSPLRKQFRQPRAGRVPGGTIVLSQERTERSRMIPSFRKNNEHLEPVLKNIGTISKRMKWNGTGIA